LNRIFINNKRRLAFAIGGLCLLGGVIFQPSFSVLKIVSFKDDRLLCCARMAQGEEFVLSFIHSVNRLPVFDTLRFEGNQLRIVNSRFNSFGAGMPETSTEANALSTAPDGWLVYTVDRSIPEINLFIGRVANHTLRVRGQLLPLADLAAPGSSISMRPSKANLFQLLTHRCL
jgi:hypothetical protein